jgi:hypothetical protein
MKSLAFITIPSLALVLAAGCASTTLTAQPTALGREKIARPDRIIVYNFAVTPADLPPWSAAAAQYGQTTTSQTAEQMAAGRKLGAQVAQELVAEIQKMGMTAVLAEDNPGPRIGDVVIIGYFGSVDDGSTAKRLILGFGSGGAELKTAVEGYLMTDRGLRLLGSGETDAGASKGPGLLVPLVVTAATANPIGLIVSGAVKAEGEVSGRTTIKGSAERTAKKIAERLQKRFEEQGWIQPS